MSLLAAAAIGGAVELGKAGFGAYQYFKGRKAYNRALSNRPGYEIPNAVNANVNLAKEAYAQGMPGFDIAQNQLYGSTANALSRAEDVSASSTDLLGATTDMYAKELEGLNQLALNRATMQSNALGQLMNANQALAAEQSKEFEMNKWIPWQMKVNRESERMNFGMSMMGSGIQGAAGVASNYFTSKSTMDKLTELYGQNNNGGFGTLVRSFSGDYSKEFNPMSMIIPTGRVTAEKLRI